MTLRHATQPHEYPHRALTCHPLTCLCPLWRTALLRDPLSIEPPPYFILSRTNGRPPTVDVGRRRNDAPRSLRLLSSIFQGPAPEYHRVIFRLSPSYHIYIALVSPEYRHGIHRVVPVRLLPRCIHGLCPHARNCQGVRLLVKSPELCLRAEQACNASCVIARGIRGLHDFLLAENEAMERDLCFSLRC